MEGYERVAIGPRVFQNWGGAIMGGPKNADYSVWESIL